ncbi:MAG: zinc-ribbon domain-containing protein [Desulfatiglandales bacterium]
MFEYVVILCILVVVGYLIFQPLLRQRDTESISSQSREIKGMELEKQKEDVYAAIKEMDFDFGMGKISEEDYQELRSQYKAKALEIMKEADRVDKKDDMDAAIEREVQRLREKKAPKKKKGDKKETGVQINFCPHCGTKVGQSHKFCKGCGKSLSLSGERA